METDPGDEASSSGDLQTRFDVSPHRDSEVCAPPSFPSCDDGDGEVQWQHALGLCDGDIDVVFSTTTQPGACLLYTSPSPRDY